MELSWLQGRLAEAVDAYEKAQMAAPNFAIVHTNLAIALTEMGTHAKMSGGCYVLSGFSHAGLSSRRYSVRLSASGRYIAPSCEPRAHAAHTAAAHLEGGE